MRPTRATSCTSSALPPCSPPTAPKVATIATSRASISRCFSAPPHAKPWPVYTRELVDFDNPEASTILTWIDRATPGDGITQAVINEEYEGFLAWIEQSATCGTCPTFDNPCDEAEDAGEPCTGDEVFVDPGDCSEHTREALFQDRVYRWRDRCYPCHFDNKDNDGPNWIVTGSCNLASLKTMHNIRNAGYIDWQNPAKSLLLQKPLAQSAGGIEHGGHDKFSSTEDQAYRDFLSWIEREVSCTP